MCRAVQGLASAGLLGSKALSSTLPPLLLSRGDLGIAAWLMGTGDCVTPHCF